MTPNERTYAHDLIARMRRTPAFAFASTFIHITPPAEAPPSPIGGEWTSVGWFANVVRLRTGADISVGMWALALDDAGVELRTGRRGIQYRGIRLLAGAGADDFA